MDREVKDAERLEKNLRRLEALRPRLERDASLSEQLDQSIATLRTLLGFVRRRLNESRPSHR